MAITQESGHMHHSTVTNIGPEPSDKLTNTGGELAKSSPARLQAAYPGSPIWLSDEALGGYTAEYVAGLKGNLVKNTVKEADMKSVQSYYGWPAPVSDELAPSSGDLSYQGAPNIPSVTTDKNAKAIASPYMPNLLPPDSFNPIEDNQAAVVLSLEESHSATTPFNGDGLLSPHATSTQIEENLKPKEGSGSDAGADAPPIDGSGAGA
jgi:hypothetical protein